VRIAAVQNHYTLSKRRSEVVADYCAREEIAFVPFFPLRGDGGRALAEIAKRHGATSTQIALAWLLRRSQAMLPIPSTLSLGHMRENLAALEIELTDAKFDALRSRGVRSERPSPGHLRRPPAVSIAECPNPGLTIGDFDDPGGCVKCEHGAAGGLVDVNARRLGLLAFVVGARPIEPSVPENNAVGREHKPFEFADGSASVAR
jgi:hypothetical protein